MPKKVDLSVTITLPDNFGGGKVGVDSQGNVIIVDKDGNEIVPESVERSTHYERAKGKKYQSKTEAVGIKANVDGLQALATLDSFIVVDTNSIEIGDVKVSAAFFIVCRLVAVKDGYSLESLDNCGHVYEFHDVPDNPELLSIYRIANDTLKGKTIPDEKFVGFVTDTELSKHHELATGSIPIYRNNRLPPGFKLFYASSDSGQELLNRLMRFCDTESSKYLRRLQEGGFRTTGLGTLEEDRSVSYRYTYYPSLSIENSIITGTTVGPNTRHTVTTDDQGNP